MKPPLIYSALALAFLGAGILSGRLPVLILCCYCALPCLILAAAYLLGKPGVFRKRTDGSLPAVTWLVFGPYLLANRAFLLLYRRFLRAAQWHEIVPGLYLGECLRKWDKPDWTPLPFHVLDVTAELPEAPWARHGGRYLCLPLLDRTGPSQAQLRQGVEFIRAGLERGSVYVHCAYGHSRSALFVAAHLLACGRCRSADEAVAFVQARRPGVWLNRRQRPVLDAFAGRPS